MNANSDGLNVNANRFENDNMWNTDNQHRLVAPKLNVSPLSYFGGVFASSPFFHPPSILPVSSSCADRTAYFSVGIHLFSHASWRKNFTPSSFEMQMVSLCNFLSPERYKETKMFSRSSRKYPSIFPPRLWRYVFGKSARILNHREYDSFVFRSTAGARGGGEILHSVFKI